MSEHEPFTITLEQVNHLELRVRFDWPEAADLLMDEPQPLGHEKGPNATRLLAAAVGNCLTASLLFCLAKSRVEVAGVRATVTGELTRNEKGRLRIGKLGVKILLPEGVDTSAKGLERCLGLFEDYCVVTASVRRGIAVEVEIHTAGGESLLPREMT
ncbi:MAG: OsmC family protein [Acidobacteriota bacterium]|nr:MAG: OsmC family protein [Acidobacteriota bacterium]